MKISLLLPLVGAGNLGQEVELVAQYASQVNHPSVWLRDVAAVASDDPDPGSLVDPFCYAVQLANQVKRLSEIGVATVPIGSRAPSNIARAACSVEDMTGVKMSVSIGSGAKRILDDEYGLPGDRARVEQRLVDTVHAVSNWVSEPRSHEFRRVSATNASRPDLLVATSDPEILVARQLPQEVGWLTRAKSPLQLAAECRLVRGGTHRRVVAAISVTCSEDYRSKPVMGTPGVVSTGGKGLIEIVELYRKSGVSELLISNLGGSSSFKGILDVVQDIT